MTKPFLMPQPESRAGVRKPGMMVLPQGVERHPVPGGGSRAVPIFAGDQITLQDVEDSICTTNSNSNHSKSSSIYSV